MLCIFRSGWADQPIVCSHPLGVYRWTSRAGRRRRHPPDFINIKVEELLGDQPFEDLDSYITQDELQALSEANKRVAGFALGDVG